MSEKVKGKKINARMFRLNTFSNQARKTYCERLKAGLRMKSDDMLKISSSEHNYNQQVLRSGFMKIFSETRQGSLDDG